ncbi:(2Fe-2S)-binding protein [Chenggangzhangella methanolivorans]|uniref:Bacterioferritin-associated ferredoxin n=1 Tax=Chenggangzhangella methanolivorans TaxID=1437009 RepID=A0A9E6R6J0_9HYPH|nr:(2Fe-2S)-binding protein [Chenggangzhangella methanolivorans]QZN99170.1 (2Fe-2S)-binding protein [Chenggangzhangella methanolivorans]
MIVCSCNVLSDAQIRTTIGDVEAKPQTPGQVYRCLGCSPQCGRCARTIRAMLADIKGLQPRTDEASACGTCPAACPAVTHGVGEVLDFVDDVVEVATIDRRRAG